MPGRNALPLWVWMSGGLLLVGSVWFVASRGGDAPPYEPPSRWVEPAAICGWRDPEGDRGRLFPGADGTRAETWILSGVRPELAAALGRPATVDEMTLPVFRIEQGGAEVGVVLTRRFAALHGAMEVVVGLEPSGAIRGVGVQRMREPAAAADFLTGEPWLRAFVGRKAGGPWEIGSALPLPPAEARGSAEAMVEAIRSLLVLYEVGKTVAPPASKVPHH